MTNAKYFIIPCVLTLALFSQLKTIHFSEKYISRAPFEGKKSHSYISNISYLTRYYYSQLERAIRREFIGKRIAISQQTSDIWRLTFSGVRLRNGALSVPAAHSEGRMEVRGQGSAF